MTIQYGDTGRVSFGSLKTLNITPYVNEQNLTSTVLPVGANASSVPGSPLVTFTVNTSTMVPTFSGVNVLSYKPIYGMNVSGQNTSGSAQTVYYQINKNGTNYKTGNTSITNNNYWTLSLIDGTFVNGDRIDFYIWTPASSGVNYFYQNIFVITSRVDTGLKNAINLSYTVTPPSTNTYFPLTGKVSFGNLGNVNIYPWSNNAIINPNENGSNAVTTTFSLFAMMNTTFKLFSLQNGDVSSTLSNIFQSSTNYPQLYADYIVTQIQYRDLFF